MCGKYEIRELRELTNHEAVEQLLIFEDVTIGNVVEDLCITTSQAGGYRHAKRTF